MPLNKLGNFSFNHKEQQDDLYRVKTAAQIKQDFDSRGEELKTALNNVVDAVKSTTPGDSGAKNTGVSAIDGLVADDVQEALEGLQTKAVDLQSQITSNDGDIASLTTTKADKSYVDTQDTALQTQITQNQTSIGSLSSSKADKTYVDQQDTALQTQITSNQSQINSVQSSLTATNSNASRIEQDAVARHNNHLTVANAHKAENIQYAGDIANQTTVKGAIESVNTRVNSIVAQAGTGNTEIVDARLGADGTAHAVLKNRLDKIEGQQIETSRLTQTLSHGTSILNGLVDSPVDIAVEGRTLTTLQNTVLDALKYYVLADKKTKLKWADASVTQGVAKFTGKGERPVIIRISNLENKVSGSTVENPHKMKDVTFTNLSEVNPTTSGTEISTTDYGKVQSLNGTSFTSSTLENGKSKGHPINVDIIQEIERNVGRIPKATLAEKRQWCVDNIAKLTVDWHGWGSSVGGNKANFSFFNKNSQLWGSVVNHVLGTVSKLTFSTTSIDAYLQSDAIAHFLAYAEASDGAIASTINTDFISCEIELKPEAILHDPSVPLYEVDSIEYGNLLVTIDEAQTMTRYPRVQGSKPLDGLAVIAEGENILPSLYDGWSFHALATVKNPYELTINATATFQSSYIRIPVLPNQVYTVSHSPIATGGYVQLTNLDSNKTGIGAPQNSLNRTSVSITTTANTAFLEIMLSNNVSSGSFTFKDLMLNLGSTAKPFVPRNPSYLFAPVKLGQIGDKKDTLFRQDGVTYLRKEIERVDLDGSLAWQFHADGTGYKNIKLNLSPIAVKDTGIVTKYNGSLLTKVLAGGSFVGADQQIIQTDGAILYVTISDVETGLGESYTPTTDELKAIMFGWQAKTVDANGKPTAWRSLGDGTDAPTQTLAYVKDNKAPNFTPYRLSYVRSSASQENVSHLIEGELVVGGSTQIEVTSGIVVREKIIPTQSSSTSEWFINEKGLTSAVPDSPLKNRADKILKVYRNSAEDKRWLFATNTANQNGSVYGYIKPSDFDPTAEYTVTYLVLDRHLFTVNALAVKATYAANRSAVVDELVVRQSDIIRDNSIQNYALDYIEGKADNNRYDLDIIEVDVNNLKSSVSSGKISVRNAITGKNGTVADADGDGTPTFAELATGVGTIDTGTKIKQVYRATVGMGSASYEYDFTIPAVDLNKAIVRVLCVRTSSPASDAEGVSSIRATFLSSTQVRVDRYVIGSTVEVEIQVIEFLRGVNVHKGGVTMTPGQTTVSVTHPAVNSTKTERFFSYMGDTTATKMAYMPVLESVTTTGFSLGRPSGGGTMNARWFVVEYL